MWNLFDKKRKMDSQLLNMMFISLSTGMAMQATNSIDKVFILFSKFIQFLFGKFTKWREGPVHTIIVERVFDDSPEDINNKILIDALLDGSDHGYQFKADNRSLERKYENEYEREKARKIFVRKNETFTENGITLTIELKMRKTTKTPSNTSSRSSSTGNPNSQEGTEIEVPDREIVRLTSAKSIEEMIKFIEEKKEKYITKKCSQDITLSVFNTVLYGQSYNEFSRVAFGSQKVFDSWFIPEKTEFLKLIQDFESDSGAFAIPGVQKKLIILLYGEPGCGIYLFFFLLFLFLKLKNESLFYSLFMYREKFICQSPGESIATTSISCGLGQIHKYCCVSEIFLQSKCIQR